MNIIIPSMLLLLFAILILNLRFLKSLTKGNEKIFRIFLIALIPIVITYWFFIPNVLRVYGDEPAILTESSSLTQGFSSEYHLNAAIYNMLFSAIGQTAIYAIKLNIIFGILNIALLFLLLQIIFKNKFISFFSPLLLSANESYINNTVSSYTITIPIFFMLASALLFWLWLKENNWQLGIGSAICLCLMLTGRFEFAIAFIPALAILGFYFNETINNPNTKKIYAGKKKFLLQAALIWILAFLPYLIVRLIIWYRNKMYIWKANNFTFGLSNLIANLNAINQYLNPILLAITAVLAGIWAYRNKRFYGIMFFMFPFVILISIYSLNFSFAVWYIGILGVFSCFFIPASISLFVKSKKHLIVASVFMVLLIAFCFAVSANSSVQNMPRYSYMSTYSPKIAKEIVPENCLIVTAYSPYMKMENPSQQIKSIAEIKQYPDMVKGSSCAYFYEDYLCINEEKFTEPFKEDCKFMKTNFRLVEAISIKDKKSSLKYRIYKINPPENDNSKPIEMEI